MSCCSFAATLGHCFNSGCLGAVCLGHCCNSLCLVTICVTILGRCFNSVCLGPLCVTTCITQLTPECLAATLGYWPQFWMFVCSLCHHPRSQKSTLIVFLQFVSSSLVTDFSSECLGAVCITALCCGGPSGTEDCWRSLSGDRSGGAHRPNEHHSQE